MTDPLAPYRKSKKWHADRVGTLRASDATPIAKGHMRDIRRLWRIKTGKVVAEDEPSLPALMGQALEGLNIRWYWHTTGREVRGQQDRLVHPDYSWLGVSLDGITTTEDGREAPIEAKAVGALKDIKRLYELNKHRFKYLISYRLWEKEVVLPLLIDIYKAQCHVAMACGGWNVAVLCPLIGNGQYPYEMPFDGWYWMELFDRLQAFWACVQKDRLPDNETFEGGVR